MKDYSYENAGVNIDLTNETKREISEYLESSNRRILNKAGAFAALYDISLTGMKNPVLVLKTEEPGSKQVLAARYNRLESICYDVVHHLINDCIVVGATPLAVQDAIICGKLEKEKVLRLVNAIARACKKQGCELTGGETSVQPGVIASEIFILTSSIAGIVEKEEIIDGSSIEEQDVVLCLESNGLHTNGYTLIRRMISENPEITEASIGNESFLESVLKPHRCYYQCLKGLFKQRIIKGLAHITGGGIKENLDRILPGTIDAEIDLHAYTILPVYDFLKRRFNIEDNEMLRTFNMGVGMALVTHEAHVDRIITHMNTFGIHCYKIGSIVKGTGKVSLINTLRW